MRGITSAAASGNGYLIVTRLWSILVARSATSVAFFVIVGVIILTALVPAVVHDYSSYIASSLLELIVGTFDLVTFGEIFPHHKKSGISHVTEHGGIYEGSYWRGIYYYIIIAFTKACHEGSETPRIKEVAWIRDVWLCVKKVHIRDMSGNNSI
jgi:hypothetical protein